jgi:hypothetical protein
VPRQTNAVLAFNRGVLSTLGLARTDLTRYRMAAETMTNWMARVLGSMMLRPGWAYIGNTENNAQSKTIPFIFGATDTARLEVSQGITRFWVDDELITRNAVATTIANGSFAASIADWTNSSQAGATVTWVSAGQVSFVGTGTNNAILDQEVTVALGDEQTSQAMRIIVTRGPFTFRCGTSQGDDSLIQETTLNTGTHSLAVTPGQSSFWIRFENPNQAASLLASCNIEAAGILTLPTPWQTADLANLRWTTSADVIFVGCIGYPQQQFERRATDSWSIVDYTQTCVTGPFNPINVSNTTLTPSALTGNITLTASNPLFKPGQVGALFQIESIGQAVSAQLAGASQYSNPIYVTGVGAQRNFTITIGGTFSGQLNLQYSVGTPAGPWVDVGTSNSTWNEPSVQTYNDNNNNQSIYYRVGFDPGNYTSGTASVSLAYASGSITGICRITGYISNLEVNAAVLSAPMSAGVSSALGNLAASPNWSEGMWSTFRGFPSSPIIWGGRLWWFGVSVSGSVSDDYNNWDQTITGGSAPIIGQFDSGPVENIYYAIGLQQLVVGNASQETSIRSDYLGDPVTITNFNVMTGSTQGSANVPALQMDRSGIFVQCTGQRVFTLDLDIYTYSYKSTELTLLVPDFNSAGIVQIAIQRKPDTRIHALRADGSVGIMVYDPTENVTCWLEVLPANSLAGAGVVEDISVLPGVGQAEDQLYYIVRRVINGATVRFHEKWALEVECTGLPVAKQMDAHYVFSSATPTAEITGLTWLIGETVNVWGWNTASPFIDANGNTAGMDLGTYTVSETGTITGLTQPGITAEGTVATPFPVTNAIVGLGYIAQWQSMKQSFAAAMGTALTVPKRINKLGIILSNTHARGIQSGNDFEHLDDLPLSDLPMPDNTDTPDLNAILNTYDKQMRAFNDIWSTDSRVCLQAASPRPCTVLAFTTEMGTDG